MRKGSHRRGQTSAKSGPGNPSFCLTMAETVSLYLMLLVVCVKGCDHGCVILLNEEVYPCSTIEQVTDCKSEYFSVKEGIKTQINLTSHYELKGRSKRGFYFKVTNFEKSTKGLCYRISQSIISKYQKKSIFLQCNKIDVRKNNNSVVRNKREYDDTDKFFKAVFNQNQRVLKITLFSEECSTRCYLEFGNGSYEINISISTNETQYFSIPPDVHILKWKLILRRNIKGRGMVSFSDSSLKGNFSETPNCIHSFPELWDIKMRLDCVRKINSLQLKSTTPCFDVKEYNVRLFKDPDVDEGCKMGNTGTQIVNKSIKVIDGKHVSVDFESSSNGTRFCVRATPVDDRCQFSGCPIRYSKIVTCKEEIPVPKEVKPEETYSYEELWIIGPIIVVLLIAILIYIFYRRRPSYMKPEDENTYQQLVEKMREIADTPKQTILLLRCNEDEKINNDIDHFIKFLEECCFCEVLHAKTSDAHISISETSPIEWVTDVIKAANKTIVIITNRAYNFAYPTKFKKIYDPNFCCFSDNTFCVGVQILKQFQDLTRIFARFCYSEDVPLNELTDEVIEIPQALVYLFRCIHKDKSFVYDEAHFINYWIDNESFRYLIHLKDKEDSGRTIELPMTNNNDQATTTTTTSHPKNVFIDLKQNDLEQNDDNKTTNTGVKLTNLHNEINIHSIEVLNGHCDSGFSEEM